MLNIGDIVIRITEISVVVDHYTETMMDTFIIMWLGDEWRVCHMLTYHWRLYDENRRPRKDE